MPKIDSSIFKAYDIRGIYPDEINERVFYFIGRAYLQLIKVESKKKTPKIVIGQDARPSSPKLFQALAQGIIEEGGGVIDIGQSTTPELYFAVNFLKSDGGLMVTASHNPAGYNGLKVTREKAIPISGSTGLGKIKDEVINLSREQSYQRESVDAPTKSIENDYVEFLTKGKNINLDGKIAVDCGNGMTGPVVEEVLDKLKINFIPLYFEPDCTFPNHIANPFVDENLRDLEKVMKKENAPLGIAFDGDGDRVVFLDEAQKRVRGDFITTLLARKILKEKGAGKVLYDLRSIWTPREIIKKYGGMPVMTKVGHSLIKEKMREEDGVFAGEMSGHYFFKDFFGCESGILTMVKVLEIISKQEKTIRELIAPFQKYFHSGEVNFKIKDKQRVLEKLEEKYSEGKISHLDGLLVEFKDWWFNVRPSNTEPLLRLNLEAENERLMREKLEELKAFIESFER